MWVKSAQYEAKLADGFRRGRKTPQLHLVERVASELKLQTRSIFPHSAVLCCVKSPLHPANLQPQADPVFSEQLASLY